MPQADKTKNVREEYHLTTDDGNIHLNKNQRYHERTKHIDVCLYYIREVVSSNKVVIKKVHTDNNPADFVTKPVTTIKFEKCINLIGVADLDQS